MRKFHSFKEFVKYLRESKHHQPLEEPQEVKLKNGSTQDYEPKYFQELEATSSPQEGTLSQVLADRKETRDNNVRQNADSQEKPAQDLKWHESQVQQREEAVSRREVAVFGKEEELQVKEKWIRRKKEELDTRQVQIDKEARILELKKQEITQHQGNLADKEAHLKRENELLKEREEKIRANEDQVKAIENESRNLTNLLRDKDSRIAKLQASLKEIGAFAVYNEQVRNWLTEHNDASSLDLPIQVVTIGSGPWPSKAFDEFLSEKGYELYYPENEDVEIVVVGRTGWTEDELELQIAARHGKALRIYSQEMFVAALSTGRDPFEADEDTLLAFGRGHPALEYLMQVDFGWPSITVPLEEDEPPDGPPPGVMSEKSPLGDKGYRVGKGGLPVRNRRSILSEAFKDELPWVESDEYMELWGKPKTRKRLWRIAHHIAWLARFHQSDPSMSYAVEDWKSDLTWLKKKYYTPRMFTWPSTTV